MSPELAEQLRAARPLASQGLRERVHELAAESPQPRKSFSLPIRRIALVAVPAAVAFALGVALVHGVVHGSSQPSAQRLRAEHPVPILSGAGSSGTFVQPQAKKGAAVPTASGRLQRYGATLRVQVANRDDLSNATRHAMRFARLLGGYVASVRYSAPRSGQGTAELVVRVPVDRVQDAIEEYSGLGTLLAQRVAITDVTRSVEEEAKEIARIRGEIAALEQNEVTVAERSRLEALRARLDYLTKRRSATVRRAELARISLGLVTAPHHAAATSRFHRTLSDAGSVLVRELELLAYALIVAGPLLLLGAAVIAAGRLRDRRLFERS